MAVATKKHDGLTTDYTPGSAVAAGDVVVLDKLVGVARVDLEANRKGALYLGGVYEVPKATGTAQVMPIGADVYWDATNKVVTTVSAGNLYFGKVVDAARGANDATATVALIQQRQ